MASEPKRRAMISYEGIRDPEPPAPESPNQPKKRKALKWIAPCVLLIAALAFAGVYYLTDAIMPASAPVAEPTPLPDTRVKLIDRAKTEFLSCTIQRRDEQPYTLLSNMRFDEDGEYLGDSGRGRDFEIQGMDYFRLNEGICSNIANYATAFSAADTAEAHAADLSIYGLDDPAIVISIAYKDGSGSVLRLGDKAPVGGHFYGTFDDGDTVYLIALNVHDAFDQPLRALHTLPRTPELVIEEVRGVLVEQKNLQTVELAQQDGTIRLVQPIARGADSERAQALLYDAMAMSLSGYYAHAADDEELAGYGLLEPYAHVRLEATLVDPGDGQDADQTVEFWFGYRMDDTYTYAKLDDSGDVYLMETALTDFLADARFANLTDQFVSMVDIENVEAVEFENAEGERHTMAIKREPTYTEEEGQILGVGYYIDNVAMEEQAFKELYRELISVQFDRPVGDMQPTGTSQPELVVRFKRNDNQENMLVEYLTFDDDYDLVRIGPESLFLVKREKVLALIDALNAAAE